MCDEYDDARMRAFWRAITTAESDEERKDEELLSPIVPIALEPIQPMKRSPRTVTR